MLQIRRPTIVIVIVLAVLSGCSEDAEEPTPEATSRVDVTDLPEIETRICDYATGLDVCGGHIALKDVIDVTVDGSEAASDLLDGYFASRRSQAAATYDNLAPLLDSGTLSPVTRSWLDDFLRGVARWR